jgi:class 3 adenylate cyclase
MRETPSRKLTVIVHADVVGSTMLVQKDELLAHERIRAAFRALSETIDRYAGSTAEIRGDGLASAAKAVAFDHDDSKSQYLLGFLLQLNGRLDEANTHLQRALHLTQTTRILSQRQACTHMREDGPTTQSTVI